MNYFGFFGEIFKKLFKKTKLSLNYIFLKNGFISYNLKKNNYLEFLFKNSDLMDYSSNSKFLTNNVLSNSSFGSDGNYDELHVFYLRKNSIFNKGRYSRNRQLYRTGVYWCLYLNIILFSSLYLWFYRFNINFGYLWYLLYFIPFLFFFNRFFNLRLYKLNTLVFILNRFWRLVLYFFSYIKYFFYVSTNNWVSFRDVSFKKLFSICSKINYKKIYHNLLLFIVLDVL